MTPTDVGKPIEVLLVEDNPADFRLTQEALKEAKIRNTLHSATDGVEALDFLYARGDHAGAPRPDLVILDLNLPKMDGREVLKAIKTDAELRRIPVVVLTTSAAEEDILRSYDDYANCYITKPVQMDDFVEIVKAIDDFWFAMVRLPPD